MGSTDSAGGKPGAAAIANAIERFRMLVAYTSATDCDSDNNSRPMPAPIARTIAKCYARRRDPSVPFR